MSNLSNCRLASLGIALSQLIAGCSPLKSNASWSTQPKEVTLMPEGTAATVSSEAAGSITASFDANSTLPQLMQASADSNISNVVVAFPPGSLSISTEISMRESPPINSELSLSSLGSAVSMAAITTSGAAVEVSSSQPIDLLHPMILALPLPAGLGLTVDPDAQKRLGVLYKIRVQDTGQKLIGYVPASELTIDANNRVLYPSSFFGSFQVVMFDQVVAKVEANDTSSSDFGIAYILAGVALPTCGRAEVGRTVYVQETSQFKYCGVNGWEVVDLKGPAGPAGAQGSKGETGVAGAASSATGIQWIWDGNGVKIGQFLGDSSFRNYYIKLLDGTTGLLNSQGSLSFLGGSGCYHASNDCSDVCFIPNSNSFIVGDYIYASGKDVGGAGVHFVYVKVTSVSPLASINAVTSSTGDGSCNTLGTPQTLTGSITVAPFTPPTFTPPFDLHP